MGAAASLPPVPPATPRRAPALPARPLQEGPDRWALAPLAVQAEPVAARRREDRPPLARAQADLAHLPARTGAAATPEARASTTHAARTITPAPESAASQRIRVSTSSAGRCPAPRRADAPPRVRTVCAVRVGASASTTHAVRRARPAAPSAACPARVASISSAPGRALGLSNGLPR